MPIRRSLTAAAVAALTLTGVGATAGTAAAAPPAGSPLSTYIVTLDAGSVPAQVAARAEHQFGGRIDHVYTAALKGFAVRLPEGLAARLSTLPGVAGVEKDQDDARADHPEPRDLGSRPDRPARPAARQHVHLHRTGAGVHRLHHRHRHPFDPRRLRRPGDGGFDAVGTAAPPTTATATAPTSPAPSAATTYGVAKDVTLVAVRVLDCSGSGTTAGVIAGIDWVTANHQAGQPAVANMSLGGGASTALDDAVRQLDRRRCHLRRGGGQRQHGGVPQTPATPRPRACRRRITVGATDNIDTRGVLFATTGPASTSSRRA